MLNKTDLKGINNSVKKIIVLTFGIEFVGALLLFPYFLNNDMTLLESIYYSVFHSISAFCNAGFSLFSDSLESFRGYIGINLIIAGLIIAGGISFSVLTELSSGITALFKRQKFKFSINTRVVLNVTLVLIFGGMFVIYKLEHMNQLVSYPVYQQYLIAFFQSVTLRTAGFNTISFGSMRSATLMFTVFIMFIGGAAGSTAGGIKVNTLGVVWAYIQSYKKGADNTLIYKHVVSKDSILQAFTIIIFGMLSIMTMSILLLITEDASTMEILFESVSAFATVGLSTGITPSLSVIGKLSIIILMFFGRLGPLTLLTASSRKSKTSRISYPEAKILVG
jgi:trk system potassium uptake protein TrkH